MSPIEFNKVSKPCSLVTVTRPNFLWQISSLFACNEIDQLWKYFIIRNHIFSIWIQSHTCVKIRNLPKNVWSCESGHIARLLCRSTLRLGKCLDQWPNRRPFDRQSNALIVELSRVVIPKSSRILINEGSIIKNHLPTGTMLTSISSTPILNFDTQI